MMRRVLVVCATLAVAVSNAGVAQDILGRQAAGNAHPDLAANGERSNEPVTSLLRQLITLDLTNATVGEALREVSRQLGGRLMFDEGANAIATRVEIQESEIAVGQALQRILAGTELQVSSTNRGGVLLIKQPQPAVAPVDTVNVRGRVVDSSSGEPVTEVVITIDSRREHVVTDKSGNFLLSRLPAGEWALTFRRIGYNTKSVALDLTAGRDTSITVSLTSQPIRLAEIVSTATGDRRKLEIGHSTAGIGNVDSVMQVTPVSSVSQLIKNRVPGLLATTSSGAVGAPTRLRIRGISSIESNNEPVIVVDGIVISNSAATSITHTLNAGVHGGTNQSGANDLSMRLDDLDPNMIESVEVMKGPAASTMYGAEAANGVIIIKTKRGRVGPPSWSFYSDYRTLAQVKDYEYPVRIVGTTMKGGNSSMLLDCRISAQYLGNCRPTDEVVGFNMLRDPLFTPQARGFTKSFGATVSGGTEGLQYFIGGTSTDQLGTAKMPEVNRTWIERARGGQKIKEELLRPNALRKNSMNARITGRIGSTASVALGANFISQTQRVGANGMAGLVAAPRAQSDTTPVVSGWQSWYGKREQDIKHIIGNASGTWHPTWLNNAFFVNATYGWDFSLRDDEYYAPKGSCHPLCAGTTDQGVLGYINTGRRTDFTQSLNLNTSFNYPLTSWLSTSTRFGGNFRRFQYYDLYGSATDLQVGVKLYAATGTKQVSNLGDTRTTAGWYLEEQLNFRQDRLFATVGLRQDAGSSIGETEKPIFVKWNVSWLASEEKFFPLRDQIDLFRVRFATGSAGVLPTTTARNRTYVMANNFVMEDGSANGFFAELGSPGDPELRAEHSREYEGGLDIELFERRLSFDLTWYKKFTKDAIDRGPVAGSVGASRLRPLLGNLGDVENQGYEFGSMLRVLDTDKISFDLSGHLASRRNKLVRLAEGNVSFISLNASGDLYTGNETRKVEGYPLFGRWAYPILGWADRDGDGMIDPLEVMVGDSLEFVGPSEPRYNAYVGSQIGLLNRQLMIAANFAYSGGQVQFNQLRKNMQQYAPAQQGMNADLRAQACVVAGYAQGTRRATDWCYMETVKLWRLQDLSIRYILPSTLVRHIGASSGVLSLSTTNLKHWSNYQGRDPDVNTAPVTGNAILGGEAFGAPREYGIRLQLNF